MSAKGKMSQKRVKNEQDEEDIMSKLIGQYQQSIKKKKTKVDNVQVQSAEEPRKKILDMVGNQLKQSQKCNKKLFTGLSEINTQLEAEYNVMKENEQKLEHLTNSYMKCIQQTNIAYKHNIDALKEIQASFEKEYEEMVNNHKSETEKFMYEFDVDMKKLQDQLIAEGKRNSRESLRKSICEAMKKDF